MKKRISFLISILLGVIAFVLHSLARDEIMRGQHLKAARIEAVAKQQISYTPDPEAVRLSSSGRILSKVGHIFTFSSLACLVVALIRRESGWYSIPIMLLLSDVVVQLLL